jgi:hypothetical protein
MNKNLIINNYKIYQLKNKWVIKMQIFVSKFKNLNLVIDIKKVIRIIKNNDY